LSLLVGAIIAIGIASSQAGQLDASETEKPGNAVPGAPADGLSSDEVGEAMRNQGSVLDAAEELDRAVAETRLTGLGGIQVSVLDREVNLYWNGELPADALEAIERRLDDLGSDVGLRVLPARYTQQTLQEEAAQFRNNPQAYPGVHRVTVLPDGSGLEVGVSSADAGEQARSSFIVDIRVVVEEGFDPWFSRRNDIPPYWGGAVVSSTTGGPCSSGFAAWRRKAWLEPLSGPRPPGYDSHMLTAEHCGGAGATWTDGGGDSMGPSERVDRSLDSVSIRTTSAPRIYDGGAQPGTEFSKPVVALGRNWPGAWVCTSGAATGVHCDIQIISTETTLNWGDHTSYRVAIGEQVSKRAAGGKGDSGGPVFMLTPDFSGVIGVGIINGGGKPQDQPATCPPGSFTTIFSWRVYYTDLEAIVYWQDLSLHTTSS
jgi:hypothetical protein